MIVKCPSGLTGEVRKLKGSEANILADRKTARKGDQYDQILRACWTKTTDAGPYAGFGVSSGTDAIDWSQILVCDRFYILFAIRIATYGPNYDFTVRCESRGCGNKIDWALNLLTELPLLDLPEESRSQIASGENRFATEVDGKEVVFSLLTGADEKRARKIMKTTKGTLFTTGLASRTVSIEGVETNQIIPFLNDLDLDQQLDLMDQFDDADGGFETTIEIECDSPSCGTVFEVNLPFEGAEFWLPRTRSRLKSKGGKTKRATRTMQTSP
jgi:hypothetical protein